MNLINETPRPIQVVRWTCAGDNSPLADVIRRLATAGLTDIPVTNRG
jgi:hypothetical protein